jgi:hypothetical protein
MNIAAIGPAAWLVARNSKQSTKYRTLNKLHNHDDNQSSGSTPSPGGFDPTPILWVLYSKIVDNLNFIFGMNKLKYRRRTAVERRQPKTVKFAIKPSLFYLNLVPYLPFIHGARTEKAITCELHTIFGEVCPVTRA